LWLLLRDKNRLPGLEPKSSPEASPAALSRQAMELKEQITKTDKKVGDLVSDYDDFTISYLISNDEYIVTIKNSPFKDSKKKAEDWFLNQGFARGDLCFLKITFVPVKNVEFSSPEDAHPTDCPR